MKIGVLLAGALCFFLFYGKIATSLLLVCSILLCLALYFWGERHHHHGGFLSIDVYAGRSRLNRYHPGLKTGFAVCSALLCVAADSLIVSVFVMTTMLLLTVGIGKTPLRYYLTLLAAPAVFIVLGTVAILFELSSQPLGLLDIPIGRGYVCVTALSQLKALRIMARAFGAVSCLYLLSLSTPMYRIISVLRSAKLPGIVVELMYLIYRYIFVLLDTQNHMQMAAESRLGYRSFRISLKTMMNNALNLIFLSLRKSSDCFAAMEARCYDGEIRFWEEGTTMEKPEILVVAGYGIALLAVWYFSGRLMG